MIKVHSSHLKANVAVSAFVKKLAEVDILADRITSDYGEDLLLQTQLGNIADTFSIRVQVKYVSLRRDKSDQYSYSLSVRHLWRWVAHADPVLLCLYDRTTGEFLVADPKSHFSLWQLATTDKRSLTIRLADDNKGTPDLLNKLVWDARLRHYSTTIASLENGFHYEVSSNKQAKGQTRQQEINVLTLSLIKAVGIIKENGKFDAQFMKSLHTASMNFSRKWKSSNLKEVFMLATLGFINQKTGCDLQGNIWNYSTELVGHFSELSIKRNGRPCQNYFESSGCRLVSKG
jgi:Domain of unknown function (DUF4365)